MALFCAASEKDLISFFGFPLLISCTISLFCCFKYPLSWLSSHFYSVTQQQRQIQLDFYYTNAFITLLENSNFQSSLQQNDNIVGFSLNAERYFLSSKFLKTEISRNGNIMNSFKPSKIEAAISSWKAVTTGT